MSKSTQGKLWVLLEGYNGLTPFKHEVQLHPHSAEMKPGFYYTFMTNIPCPINSINGLQIKYKQRNFLNKSSVGISRVVVIPDYLGSNRIAYAKGFCANGGHLMIKNQIWYRLINNC